MRALAALSLLLAGPALAAEPDAEMPTGVGVGKSADGLIHVDRKGKTLYTMSLRWAKARSGVGIEYCGAACLAAFTPLTAAKGVEPIGNWMVIDGPVGPQWAHKGNPVFTYKADQKAGDTGGDGWDYLWSTLRYTPAAPALTAPAVTKVIPVAGVNIVTDASGRALFVGDMPAAGLTALPAALASRDVGDWTVTRDGDAPRWAWRGKPVFVSNEAVPTDVPAGAMVLKP